MSSEILKRVFGSITNWRGGHKYESTTRKPARLSTRPLALVEDDELLTLLEGAPNEMLDPLVQFLTLKGRPTSKLSRSTSYQQHFPNHQMYVSEIVAEIQRYGSNDIARAFRRGKGIRYEEIVRDVAKRLKINHSSKKTSTLEQEVVRKLFLNAYDQMTSKQQLELARSLKIRNLRGLGGPFGVLTFHSAVGAGGFSTYKLTVIVANAAANSILGHGLSFTTNWMLVKGVSIVAGPLGLAFAAMLTANMIAGPAYRVTVPCVVQVALIRQQRRIKRRNRFLALLAALLCIAALALAAYLFLVRQG